jgi:hypothetical protein
MIDIQMTYLKILNLVVIALTETHLNKNGNNVDIPLTTLLNAPDMDFQCT